MSVYQSVGECVLCSPPPTPTPPPGSAPALVHWWTTSQLQTSLNKSDSWYFPGFVDLTCPKNQKYWKSPTCSKIFCLDSTFVWPIASIFLSMREVERLWCCTCYKSSTLLLQLSVRKLSKIMLLLHHFAALLSLHVHVYVCQVCKGLCIGSMSTMVTELNQIWRRNSHTCMCMFSWTPDNSPEEVYDYRIISQIRPPFLRTSIG